MAEGQQRERAEARLQRRAGAARASVAACRLHRLRAVLCAHHIAGKKSPSRRCSEKARAQSSVALRIPNSAGRRASRQVGGGGSR